MFGGFREFLTRFIVWVIYFAMHLNTTMEETSKKNSLYKSSSPLKNMQL